MEAFYEDEDDEEFDPNRCPWCGGDIEYDDVSDFAWCPDVSCGWDEDDDESGRAPGGSRSDRG